MADKEVQNTPTETKETVVVDRDARRPGGGLAALIIGLVVVALIIWLIVSALDTTEDMTPDTTTPDTIEADINTNPEGVE